MEMKERIVMVLMMDSEMVVESELWEKLQGKGKGKVCVHVQ